MRLGRTPYFQRFWLGLGLVLALALTGCGGAGNKYNEFLPSRIIVIGDEITYVGCARGTSNGQTVCAGADNRDRFAINSLSGSPALTNNWVVQLATNYGLTVDKIIEPLVTGDDVRGAKWGAIVQGTNPSYPNAMSVQTQAGNIPTYVSGDMVVIAGGANDIVAILEDNTITSTSGVTFKRGLTTTLADQIIRNLSVSAISQAKAYYIMAAAQAYQDIALNLINNQKQRHVFLAPIYDFSNSPDLKSALTAAGKSDANGFCTGCSSSQVQQGIALFNYTLRLLTDNRFEPMLFNAGDPRILVTSGTTSYDLFYVNIPYFTTVFGSVVNNYSVAKSVCGTSSANYFADLKDCKWNGVYDSTASFTGDPDFITNKGAFIYSKNQYLTPPVQLVIGNTFTAFMRGFNGW